VFSHGNNFKFSCKRGGGGKEKKKKKRKRKKKDALLEHVTSMASKTANVEMGLKFS
jgi:transcriptional regulator CtsR